MHHPTRSSPSLPPPPQRGSHKPAWGRATSGSAAPGRGVPHALSPERAKQSWDSLCAALSGLAGHGGIDTQGVAQGWFVLPFQGGRTECSRGRGAKCDLDPGLGDVRLPSFPPARRIAHPIAYTLSRLSRSSHSMAKKDHPAGSEKPGLSSLPDRRNAFPENDVLFRADRRGKPSTQRFGPNRLKRSVRSWRSSE